MPREQCGIGNVVQCWLPGNRKPTTREIAHCWEAHVGPWLRSLRSLRVIVAAGQPAAQHFIRGAKQSTAGTLERCDIGDGNVRIVVPIIHPAAIIRGQWGYDPAQPVFLRRAWIAANADDPPVVEDVAVVPPGGRIARTADEACGFLAGLLANPPPFAYTDIEGVGGVLIGIGFWAGESGLYVPFRDRAAPYWDATDCLRVAAAVDAVLGSPAVPKVFHNGSSFDVPFLESIGFEVRGYADDTMVRAWATYHEMGKSLEELAILYANMPAWKHTSHVGDEGEGK